MLETAPVLIRMKSLIDSWEDMADRRSIFLACYAVMTRNMLASINTGVFCDPVWVNRLLEEFAEYYFKAVANYETSMHASSQVWKLTFEATREPKIMPVQHLILGVNAHINYDLVLTLVDLLEPEWPTLSSSLRLERFADHCTINQIIARSVDEVQDTILERHSPGMDLIDKIFGRLDEWMISNMIARWRDRVWQQSVQWVEAVSAEEKISVLKQVESSALRKAQWIKMQWKKQDFEKNI
jgi:hypothetical protein